MNDGERLYLFYREEGFYPVPLNPTSVKANIDHNPGTLRVDDALIGPVWTNSDGFLDEALRAIQL